MTYYNKQYEHSGKLPIPKFRPTPSNKKLRPFGLCAGKFSVPDDFDAPLPEDILSEFEENENFALTTT